MPLRELEITDRAYRSLVDIALRTIETFGARQVQKYKQELLARCRAIAAGEVQHRSCRMAFDMDLSADLRVARCGRHYVIFTETERTVHVIDFLHQSADISARLEG